MPYIVDVTVDLIRGSTSFGKRLGITAWHLFFHRTVRATDGNGCQTSLRIWGLVKVCGKRNAVTVVERDSRMFHLIALRKGLISFLRQFQWFHTGWIYIFCCCRFLCLTGDIYGFMTYRSSLHGGTFLFDGGTFECGSYPSWQFRARLQFFLGYVILIRTQLPDHRAVDAAIDRSHHVTNYIWSHILGFYL